MILFSSMTKVVKGPLEFVLMNLSTVRQTHVIWTLIRRQNVKTTLLLRRSDVVCGAGLSVLLNNIVAIT